MFEEVGGNSSGGNKSAGSVEIIVERIHEILEICPQGAIFGMD